MGIRVVRPDKDRAKTVRRTFGACLRHAIDTHGDDIAGFAIVSWDMRGGTHSSILAESGPFVDTLVPTFAHDALNRHVAVLLTERTATISVNDD